MTAANAKYTPGPWEVTETREGYRIDACVTPDAHVEVARDVDDLTDARLIASAPDLVEALKGYMHAMEGFAEAVRAITGTAYPWEAQDIERAKALAALSKAGV